MTTKNETAVAPETNQDTTVLAEGCLDCVNKMHDKYDKLAAS